jgi:hypothetical protein
LSVMAIVGLLSSLHVFGCIARLGLTPAAARSDQM